MTIAFLVIILLPSFFMVSFSLPSLATGLIFASCAILCIKILKKKRIKISKGVLLMAAFGGVWSFFNPYSIANSMHEKQMLSLLALLLCGFAITSSIHLRSKDFNNSISIAFWILLLVGSMGALGFFKPGNYQLLSKAMTPFAEPSHFALTFLPIACAYIFTGGIRLRFFVCVAGLFLSLFIQNFTLLIGALLLSLVALSLRQIILFSVIALGLSLALVIVDPTYSEYFIDRVVASEGENISRLVYIQGWESMISALQFTNGLGVGFQNFGIEPSGAATALLDALIDGPLNRSDGGFLAAKVVGEFGIIGIIAIVFITFLSIRSGIELRESISRGAPFESLSVAPLCFTYMIIVEFFVRGTGYFSPSFLIFLCFAPMAIKTLVKNSKKQLKINHLKVLL